MPYANTTFIKGRFYIPRYRYELLDYFKKQRPEWKMNNKSKQELPAIYFEGRGDEQNYS